MRPIKSRISTAASARGGYGEDPHAGAIEGHNSTGITFSSEAEEFRSWMHFFEESTGSPKRDTFARKYLTFALDRSGISALQSLETAVGTALIRERASTPSSVENIINDRRLEKLRREFSSELLQALQQDPPEPGVLGRADDIVERNIRLNQLATVTWLNTLFTDNFKDSGVACDLLMLAGRLPYRTANPTVVTMALAGLSHKSVAVKEAAIRAFENWANSDSLEVLENVSTGIPWLDEYIEEVMSDIKESL